MKKLLWVFLFLGSIASAQESHVTWSSQTKKISDCEYDIIFTAKIDPHWHIYSLQKTEPGGPNPTSFTFTPNKFYNLDGKIAESKPVKEFDKVFEMNVAYHENKATFTQRIQLHSGSDKVIVKGRYEAQCCDSAACSFPPADDFSFSFSGSTSCPASDASATVPEDTSAVAAINLPQETPSAGGLTKGPMLEQGPPAAEDVSGTSLSWFGIFFAGFLGGFAALLTPCVFPMIPMNVSFFTKQSKTKKQGFRNAIVYAIFLILLYVGLGLGVTVVFGAGALHSLSTNVWFNLAFFLLLLVFAISFLGAFEIVLPSGFVNKMDAKSEKGGYIGIFFMAFTLALVSFSCTGPIIGTLLVEAASGGGISGPFWGMFGFSLALALPFGLFAAFPGWLNALPKSGGWLNSVKVVLGFLELALALKFASNADLVYQTHYLDREVFITLWIVIFGLQGAYLLGAFKTAHDSDLKHVSVTRLFFAIISLFISIYLIPGLWGAPLKLFSGILPPIDYSEAPKGFGGAAASAPAVALDKEFADYMEVSKGGIVHFKNDYAHALAYARKVDKPLMVDFTGHACANCRKTEDYVWPDDAVTSRLNNEVVLVSLFVDDKRPLQPKDYMHVNWYGKERVITDIGDKFKYMEETLYKQSTQPLYVMLDHNEKLLNKVRGYNPSVSEYIKWMDEGISSFKNQNAASNH